MIWKMLSLIFVATSSPVTHTQLNRLCSVLSIWFCTPSSSQIVQNLLFFTFILLKFSAFGYSIHRWWSVSFKDSVCLRVCAALIIGCNFFLSKEKSPEKINLYRLDFNILISLTAAWNDLMCDLTNSLKATFVTGSWVRMNSASGRLYFASIRLTLCGQYRCLRDWSRSKWSSNSEQGPGFVHMLWRSDSTVWSHYWGWIRF